MAKSMTKSQIAEYLAENAGLTKKGTVQILDDLAALAYREATNAFTVPGIGKLKLSNRKARIGRNPQTGPEIKIPAKQVIKFRVAKVAKDAILGKKAKRIPARRCDYPVIICHYGLGSVGGAYGCFACGRNSNLDRPYPEGYCALAGCRVAAVSIPSRSPLNLAGRILPGDTDNTRAASRG